MQWKMIVNASKIVGTLCWNFLLFFLAFLFSLLFSRSGGVQASIVFYFFTGAFCFFWTPNVLFIILPAGIAFPLAITLYSSAVISDDTGGKSDLSFWSALMLMDRDAVQVLIYAVIAATIGWLLLHLVFRKQPELTRQIKPYFLFVSASIVVLCLIWIIGRSQ